MKWHFLPWILGMITISLFTSWGFFAHQRINHLAVFTLPKNMIRFYKNNIDYITAHAVDPDKRRYADALEAPRHFLDADHYGLHPFDSIPEKWEDAVNKYGEDYLNKYGTVPWVIQRNYFYLVKAFKNKDSLAILRSSAQLGHYIADAHVPLHMSENYNGQLSNQVGIHAFWESRLPELYSMHYDFYVGKARYIEDPLKESWKICRTTFNCLDSTLLFERQLHKTFPSDKKYTYTTKGNRVVKEYSEEYSNAYHQMLDGMVERQMRSAILAIGSFWYTAWVDAGQPDFKNMDRKPMSTKEQQVLEQEEILYQNGRTLGRDE